MLTILSTHATIAEAMQASGIDFSYNPEEARTVARMSDTPPPRAKQLGLGPTLAAYVVQDSHDGSQHIRFAYERTERGLVTRCLKVFQPFCVVMHDGDLYGVRIVDNTIVDAGVRWSKYRGPAREAAARWSTQADNHYITD